MTTPTQIVAYLALFVLIGIVFLLVNLLLGKLVRPADPHAEKTEIYECGEPAIGTSFVQFDLRFYVVALVFIVFDAEVAFLFPSATVFGKITQLADPRVPVVTADAETPALSDVGRGLYAELGVSAPTLAKVSGLSQEISSQEAESAVKQASFEFGLFAFVAIMVFFVILLIGFAYEWKTGAYDWVRALPQQRERRVSPLARPVGAEEERETVLMM